MDMKEFEDIPLYMVGVATELREYPPFVHPDGRITYYSVAQLKEASKKACLAEADNKGMIRYSYANKKERKAIIQRNIAKAQYYSANGFKRMRIRESIRWILRHKERWIANSN
jgi:hypothetical protein